MERRIFNLSSLFAVWIAASFGAHAEALAIPWAPASGILCAGTEPAMPDPSSTIPGRPISENEASYRERYPITVVLYDADGRKADAHPFVGFAVAGMCLHRLGIGATTAFWRMDTDARFQREYVLATEEDPLPYCAEDPPDKPMPEGVRASAFGYMFDEFPTLREALQVTETTQEDDAWVYRIALPRPWDFRCRHFPLKLVPVGNEWKISREVELFRLTMFD